MREISRILFPLRASGMTRSVMTWRCNREAKVNRELTCRVKVPVEALMTGTPSRTARVPSVRWDLKEAVGKLPARGTRTAYEATSWWARGRIDLKPDVIRIETAYMRRVCGRKVTRLTLRDLSSCRLARSVARRADGTAEVSRGHSSWSESLGCPPTYSPAKGRTV